jgi:hypothetical protein
MPLRLNPKGFEKRCAVAHTVSPLTGLAELVHNAYAAQATRLDILVRSSAKPDVPAQDMLLFRDNGTGMNTEELIAMLDMDTDNPPRPRRARPLRRGIQAWSHEERAWGPNLYLP